MSENYLGYRYVFVINLARSIVFIIRFFFLENEKNFVIHPAIINLRPKERRPFECKFEPQNKEMLMGGHIYGRAQIYDLEANVKKEMIFLRLRLIGILNSRILKSIFYLSCKLM